MTQIEKLEDELVSEGAIIDDQTLEPDDPDGLYIFARGKPPLVLINRRLCGRRKLCVLAEEAGHHYRSFGPTLNDCDAAQKKNELDGRRWAYKKLVPLEQLVNAWHYGCRTPRAMANYFGVTVQFFESALGYYHSKYGIRKIHQGHIIQFDPYFQIYDI